MSGPPLVRGGSAVVLAFWAAPPPAPAVRLHRPTCGADSASAPSRDHDSEVVVLVHPRA